MKQLNRDTFLSKEIYFSAHFCFKQMKQSRYIEKTLKQDVTDQKPWSVLVTEQGETI